MDSDSIISIIALVILVFLSGFFSATETAFSSLNRIKIKSLADAGNKRAALVLKLSDNFDKLLSTILVGNNIVNIGMASLGTVLFVKHFGNIGATVSTVVITVVVLIFGEISPKNMAKESPQKFAMAVAPSISFLIIILTPINFMFSLWKKLLSKIMKNSEESFISDQELITFVEEAEQEGGLNEQESRLIKSAIEFDDREADEILTPRVDIIGVEDTAKNEEIIEIFGSSEFSRLPVYTDSIDKIIGIIHQKDFYQHVLTGEKTIIEAMSPPQFVVPSMKISHLLKLMQVKKTHLVVVADEYGGTEGIITMEDILEELVGEIWDEHDEIIEEFKKIDENTYRVICSADLDEMFEFFNLTGEADVATVSGWVVDSLETIPKVGDEFTYENLTITVKSTDSRRVLEIEVKVNENGNAKEEK